MRYPVRPTQQDLIPYFGVKIEKEKLRSVYVNTRIDSENSS